MQLDLFEHDRGTALRNELIDALGVHDAGAARQALATLAAEFPDDRVLAQATPLIAALDDGLAIGSPPLPDGTALARLRHRIDTAVVPAAHQLLGIAPAQAWLQPLWRALAQRAASLAWDSRRPDDHAAPLWLAAADWPAAGEAVTGIASWRRIPQPLAWMTEAQYRLQDLDATWPLLAELAWLAPARLAVLAQRLADPLLDRLLKAFGAGFDGGGDEHDLAWFPAWVLTEQPALARALDATPRALDTPPEQALRLMLALLRLEREGRQAQVLDHRRQLRECQPAVFAAYMAQRAARAGVRG